MILRTEYELELLKNGKYRFRVIYHVLGWPFRMRSFVSRRTGHHWSENDNSYESCLFTEDQAFEFIACREQARPPKGVTLTRIEGNKFDGEVKIKVGEHHGIWNQTSCTD